MATRTQRVRRGLETQLELKPTTSEWLKEGYRFLGWDTNPNATTPTYLDGDWGTFQADNTILHAIWQQDYVIVGAFGFSTYINGYNSDKQKAVQRIANYDIEWTDMADTSMISVTDVGHSPSIGGKFIRTVYTSTNSAKPEYSTDGRTWTKSNTKMAKQVFCCGGVYNGSPRYIVVCNPTTPGKDPGNFVGPWWSDDAITWTRSKFLNSDGSLQNYYTNYDPFEDCYYGRISVSGEEGDVLKDVFLV